MRAGQSMPATRILKGTGRRSIVKHIVNYLVRQVRAAQAGASGRAPLTCSARIQELCALVGAGPQPCRESPDLDVQGQQ